MKKKAILISGSSGFIGTELRSQLEKKQDLKYSTLRVDRNKLSKFNKTQYDEIYLIHLAGVFSLNSKDDDKLYGGEGDDQIFGGKDDDKIDGGRGDDKIFGNKGNDILYGCRGDDKLYGGKGADTYIISPGKDKIYRFNVVDGDVVAIDSSASYSIKTFGNHAIIDHDKGSALIKNISTSDLEAVIRIF